MKNIRCKPEYLLLVIAIVLMVVIGVEATRVWISYQYSITLGNCQAEIQLLRYDVNRLQRVGIQIYVMDATKYRLVSGVELGE